MTHEDNYFGPQQIYPKAFVVRVPVTGGNPATIKLVYQGCADAGLCYPPQTRVFDYRDCLSPAARRRGRPTAAPTFPSRTGWRT